MAIDSKPEPVSDRLSAIENEIPSYRAISTAAIVSLALGLVSVLNVASLWFLIASAGAVLAGVLALKAIRRYPDLYTGAALAKVGIVAGVICGLGATTSTVVQDLVLRTKAGSFAKGFAKILQEKDFPDVAWFHSHPEHRKDKSGQAILDEFRKTSREPGIFEQEFGGMGELKSAIDQRQLDVQYDHLEMVGTTELVPFAAAVYSVKPKQGGGTPEYALARLKGYDNKGRIEWIVEQVVYPYQLGTVQPPMPKIDDGHGHGGGDDHGH